MHGKRRGVGSVSLITYLDDFIVLGPPSSEVCAEHLQILQKVCNDMGVFLAPENRKVLTQVYISKNHNCMTVHACWNDPINDSSLL